MSEILLAKSKLNQIAPFVPKLQRRVLRDFLENSEEKSYFAEKIIEIARTIESMPVTYEQDGLGDEAIAHLHYFGSGDWYITEKDMDGDGTRQAFGYGVFDQYVQGAEIGYIPICELVHSPFVELDLHFTPKPIKEIRKVV